MTQCENCKILDAEIKYYNLWARNIATELGCADASRYRHDAIEAIKKLKVEVEKWRAKYFNDVMAAKKSGYDDAQKELQAYKDALKVEKKKERIETIVDEIIPIWMPTHGDQIAGDFARGVYDSRERLIKALCSGKLVVPMYESKKQKFRTLVKERLEYFKDHSGDSEKEWCIIWDGLKELV